MSGNRVSPRLRKFLGQRLRTLRKQRGWSQRALGRNSGLSGKFIGEVERGEKSISIDSLYGVSRALKVSLRTLTDAPSDRTPVPSEDAEKLLALLVQHRARRHAVDEPPKPTRPVGRTQSGGHRHLSAGRGRRAGRPARPRRRPGSSNRTRWITPSTSAAFDMPAFPSPRRTRSPSSPR